MYIPSNAPGQQNFTVDPAGAGATNTINRAELSGIWGALHLGQHMIATDSATSLSAIRKALLSPMDLKNHKHREMAGHIVDRIRQMLEADPDLTIQLFKVKAHSGDIGNEIVDQDAKRAAIGEQPPDLKVPISATPSYISNYWPHTTTAEGKKESLDNLQHSLREHMHKRHRLGRSNTDSIYYRLWQRIRPQADGGISNKFINHPAVTFGARRVALKWRHGTLWNNKKAFQYGMSSTPMCPLCGQMDGAGHISGGCSHATMNRMYTERHHHTGRLLLRAIDKGNMGADIVMADLGSAEKCERDGAPKMTHNRVPPELLTKLGSIPHEGRTKYQPDVMILHQGENDETPTITIVEFKYCRDTQPEDQLQHCHAQHASLITALGTTCKVKLIPILIGHSGTVFTEHTVNNMKQLGISSYHAEKCALKMHIDAIQQLHSIVKTRRHLEHATGTAQSAGVGTQQARRTTRNWKGTRFRPP